MNLLEIVVQLNLLFSALMVKAVVLTLFYLGLFNFLLYRFKALRFKHFKPFVTYLLFNLKFITGIGIWFIYTFYYKDVQNNDVHKFYTDALVVRQAATEDPKAFVQLMTGMGNTDIEKYTSQVKNWERNFDESPFNENKTIIRLNALLMFVSFKTYFVHILFMCFFSLLGWVLLTDAVFSLVNPRNAILALPVLFLPSVLFWSSGVMKEPILVLGIGLFIHGIISDRGFRIADITAVLAGAMLILYTKFFVLVCLLPAIVAYYIFKKNEKPTFLLLKYAVVNVVLLLIAFNIHFLIPKIDPQKMLVNKQMHSVKEAEYFNAGSRIEIPELTNDPISIIKAAPVGIWNTLARPYFWEAKNPMMLASTFEHLFILPFVLLCLSYADWKNMHHLNVVLLLINGALIYFALIGMGTPVLGNLVRYKTPLLPMYLFAFAMLMDQKYIAHNLDFVLASPQQ